VRKLFAAFGIAVLLVGVAAAGLIARGAQSATAPRTRTITTSIVPSMVRGPQGCFGFLGGPVTICSPSMARRVHLNHNEAKKGTLSLVFHGRQFSWGGNPALVQAPWWATTAG